MQFPSHQCIDSLDVNEDLRPSDHRYLGGIVCRTGTVRGSRELHRDVRLCVLHRGLEERGGLSDALRIMHSSRSLRTTSIDNLHLSLENCTNTPPTEQQVQDDEEQ